VSAARALAPVRTRRTIGGDLYRIALEELGDAEQWDRIADLNNLDDPVLSGYVELKIPARLPSAAAR
jgi:nucleoid-associated protein YgaU